MDDLQIIKEVFEKLSDDGFCHSPKISKEKPSKLFNKQECDIEGVEWEWVDQRSGGCPAGDDYYGTYAVKLSNGQYLYVQYG